MADVATTTAADAGRLEALAERLDEAMARRAELDPLPRQVLNDALEAHGELHRDALTTIVTTLRADPRGKELLFALVDDPAVHMVLAMHGIIRTADPHALAEKALEGVRPGIASHGGDVKLVKVEDGIAFVQLEGACNGCSMAAVTMRNGVEKALVESVPGIRSVEVVPNPPPGTEAGATGHAADAPPEGTGWCRTFPLERFGVGTLEAMSLTPENGPAVEAIVVNTGGQLAAYVNSCAHQGMPLDNAIVDADACTLTCPWHGWSYDSTNGECLTAPGAQLEPLPLRIAEGHVWVRAGT